VSQLSETFLGYKHYDRRRIMPHTWQPDICAIHIETGTLLLVEVKGRMPHSTMNEASNQVYKYGKMLYEETNLRAKLMVIGPWRYQKRNYGVYGGDGFAFGFLRLTLLGQLIADGNQHAIKSFMDIIPASEYPV
jgi:hypothetical protein